MRMKERKYEWRSPEEDRKCVKRLTVVRAGRPHRYRKLALERLDLHLLLFPLSSLGLSGHLAENRVVGGTETRATALPRLLSSFTRRPGAGFDINVVIRHGNLVVYAKRIGANDLLLRLQYDFFSARLRQRLQRYHRLPVLALDRRLHGLARYLHRYRLYLDLLDVRLDLHFGYYVRGRHINLRRRRHVNVPKWPAGLATAEPRRGLERLWSRDRTAHVTLPATRRSLERARLRCLSRRHLGSAARRFSFFPFILIVTFYSRLVLASAIPRLFHRSTQFFHYLHCLIEKTRCL